MALLETINHWMIKSYGIGETPEDLWKSMCQYFMWCEENPIYKKEMIKQTGALTTYEIPRPYDLITMCCVHLGISPSYILDLSKRNDPEGYGDVARRGLAVIRAQKYEYAATGIFNANLIGKELGFDTGKEKSAAIINITVDNSGPPLLTDEQNVIL